MTLDQYKNINQSIKFEIDQSINYPYHAEYCFSEYIYNLPALIYNKLYNIYSVAMPICKLRKFPHKKIKIWKSNLKNLKKKGTGPANV